MITEGIQPAWANEAFSLFQADMMWQTTEEKTPADDDDEEPTESEIEINWVLLVWFVFLVVLFTYLPPTRMYMIYTFLIVWGIMGLKALTHHTLSKDD